MSETSGQQDLPKRRGLKRTAARAGVVAFAALRFIRVARAILRTVVEALLALVIIFLEWGWRPLAAALGQLSRLKPVAALEVRIQTLPPYPSLLIFALPSLLLFPLKLVSLWLVASGHLAFAALVFAGAKVVGTALLARVFQLTQPKLMQLPWFARLYNLVIPWKTAIVARVKATRVWQAASAVKSRLKVRIKDMLAQARPLLAAANGRIRTWLGRSPR